MNTNEKRAGSGGASSEGESKKKSSSTPYLTLQDIESQQDSFAPRRIPFSVKDIIKSAVPVHYRVWDADDKCWWIHRDYIPLADKLVYRHTGRDELTGLTWADSWCVLHLRQAAPEAVINTVADCLIQSTDSEAIRTRIQTARRILLEW